MSTVEPGDEEPRSSLSRNTAVMAAGTLLSRLTGFGRVVALGSVLNLSLVADAYNLANNVPNIVYEMVLGGILAATLVPVLVRQFATEDEDHAWRGVSAVLTATAAILVTVAVAIALAAPWIIDLYAIGDPTPPSQEQRDVAVFLLRLFAPQVAFYGFITVATGLLHARRRFGPPMFAPILNNIAVICTLLALPLIADDISLEAMRNDTAALLFLGLGTTAGVAAMAALLVPYVRSVARGRLHIVWDLRHDAVRTMIRLSGWTVGFVIANQISLFVMLALAYRQTGGVSAFLYAYTFFILPHGIFSVSVITALQPEMAERWARRDVDGFRAQSVLGLRLLAVVMIPAAVGYALLTHPLVETFLHHGRFTLESVDLTAGVLLWMVVGLPAFSAFIFLTRAFQSMEDARTVFFLYVVQNGINVVLAVALYGPMGVDGLALSQSVGYTVAAVVAGIALARRTRGLQARSLASALLRIAVAAAVMGVVVWATARLLEGNPLFEAVGAILAGAITYVTIAHLLRLGDLQLVVRKLRRAGGGAG